MRFYCKCLAAARACASRYHCREAARRLGRPCTLLLGKAGAAWRGVARRRQQLCEATTTAAVAKREPSAAVTPPAFGHSPRPSGHNYKNRKAPARRARRHRVGTGWRWRGGTAQGIGLLLLLTADQTVATMLTHNDPITSKDNPITSLQISLL